MWCIWWLIGSVQFLFFEIILRRRKIISSFFASLTKRILAVDIPIILSEKSHENVDTNPESVLQEYKKTQYQWKNLWTLFWKFGLEPTCTYFRKTVRTICVKMYHKLKSKLQGIKPLKEDNGFYGCYQFKLLDVKNKDKTDRIQRVNRCPFTLNNDNLFLSLCYTKPNSYFIYAAKDPSKKGLKINKQNAKDAKLIAWVSLGKEYVWVRTDTPKI